MSLRPAPTRVGAVTGVSATAFIALHIVLSAWLVVQFEGQYTEGRPSPTTIKATVAVDDEQTLIDVKMERSTSFVLYMYARDYQEPEANESESPSEPAEPRAEENQESEPRAWLDQARLLTKITLVLLVVSEGLMVFGLRFRALLRGTIWFAALACFLIILPGAYLGELAGNGGDDEEENRQPSDGDLANETFVAQTEDGAMVHGTSNIDFSLAPLGIHLDMMFNGYDLGLVDKNNQSTVRAEAPEPGTEDADSWVQFESRLTAKAGKNIQSLFILPVLWFFFPAAKKEALAEGVFDEEG